MSRGSPAQSRLWVRVWEYFLRPEGGFHQAKELGVGVKGGISNVF